MAKEWERGVKMVLNNMYQMTPFRMANIIHCFKRARYVDERFFEVLVGRAYRDPSFIAAFDAKQISMTVQSLAMLARDARQGECEGIARGSFVDGESSFFTNTCLHFSKVLLQSAIENNQLVKNEFSTRELSSLMHALGIFCNLTEPREIDTMGEDVAKALIDSFCDKAEKTPEGKSSAQDYANMIHGCAAIGYNNQEALSKLLDSMEMFFANEGNYANSQSIGNILWCLGSLAAKHDRLVETLVYRAKDLDSWIPRSLADVLYGLGSLGYHDAELLSFFANYVTVGHIVMSFTERDLANSVFGFGLLGLKDPQVVHVLGNEISRLGRAANFTQQDLTRSVAGFGMLGYENEHTLWCLGAEAASKDRLWAYKHEELSEILLGFGRAGFCKQTVQGPLLHEVMDRIREVPLCEISKAIQSIAVLSNDHLHEIEHEVKGFLHEVAAELPSRGLEHYQLSDFSHMLWALAKLRYRDEKLINYVFNTGFEQSRLKEKDKICPRDVSLLLSACAELNCVNLEKSRLTWVIDYLMQSLDRLEGVEQLVQSMVGLSVLDRLDIASLELFVSKLMSLGMGSTLCTFSASTWRRVLLCIMLVVHVRSGRASNRVHSLFDRGKSQFSFYVTDRMEDQTWYLGELLRKREWRWTYGKNLKGLSIPVGFLLESKPPCIIEFSEECLFEGAVKEKGEIVLMGDELLRSKLLEAAGYEVSSDFVVIEPSYQRIIQLFSPTTQVSSLAEQVLCAMLVQS